MSAHEVRQQAPINKQITRLGLGLTGLLLGLFALLMVLHEVNNRRTDVEAGLTSLAGMIASGSEAPLMFGNERDAADILAPLRASPDIVQAALFLPDGSALAHYTQESANTTCHVLQPVERSMVVSWCGVAIYQPVMRHGERVGLLAMEASLRGAYRAMVGTLAFCGLAAALAFALSVPLWRRVASRLAGPLDELVDITRHVRENEDFSRRSVAGGSAEVQALSAAFNGMLEQLQQRDERLTDELAQRRQAELRLNDLAYLDNVTGLNNRHHFMERIDLALARTQRGLAGSALLYIDLDGFKQINDTMGHDSGDELLRQVGNRLTGALRGTDVICRLGGDEFAVILEHAGSQDQVQVITTKLVDELARPYLLEGGVGQVSASVGVCLFPAQAQDRETLLKRADAAMYQAKQQGKNCFRVWSPDGAAAPPSRQQLLGEALGQALAAGQLRVVYQPQVTLVGGGCMGMEALLRWTHPTLGVVSPAEFIPLAEAQGEIIAIGEWVLRQACAQLSSWRTVQPGLRVSVNLSAVQLADDAALDGLCAVLAASDLPCGAVELELTESLLVDRSEAMLSRMRRLRAAGFGLAIDDFGVGYSSLAYLDSFPITTLKIDRAFVQPLLQGGHSTAIARAIVAIGVALKVDVVAEGIETPLQADVLRELGCLLGQGYLFAKPLEEAAALAWVHAHGDEGAAVSTAVPTRSAPEVQAG
ncbi:MAG: hypothetical protein CFE46_00030 [Burkholderiales bacterium PBB6]|nr:MAG: hypothetical protein CFE46_00030 [Burkholderiales bacterium PBB6]